MGIPVNQKSLALLPQDVTVPSYDRSELEPGILHVGVGNFHRSHMAVYLDRLFSIGEGHEWAIIGSGVRTTDAVMRERLRPQDWLTTIVEPDPEELSARVVGSMIDFVPVEPASIFGALVDPRIRLVSLTITESGYYTDLASGKFDADNPDILSDASNPDNPKTIFGIIIKALSYRRMNGFLPFTVLSCDNLPSNGDVTQQTVTGLAALFDEEMATWIAKEVAFPNSMVDCITPRTTEREVALVRERFGIEDAAPVFCESFRQWVIEDRFSAGRPPLEKVGVEFIDDVSHHELMKLRILNASHANIAYVAALLGHHYVHEAMMDPDIRCWLVALQEREVIPTLMPIEGVEYYDYLDTIIQRFSNPMVGDTISRLCSEGSARQPKFILPIMGDALGRDLPLEGLSLELALWCRYCRGRRESGEVIHVTDALSDRLCKGAHHASEDPLSFLGISEIFGDLSQSEIVVATFSKWLTMIDSQGVISTIRHYVTAA